MDEIDVFFASDRAYYPGLFVALESCVANTEATLRFTLVLNEHDARTEKCLASLRSKPNVSEIRVLKLQGLKGIHHYKGRCHFSKMAFARLLMGEIYPSVDCSWVLYLDPDIIVHNDVSALWELRAEHPLMMSDQHNSGVLLIDLGYWRDQDIDQQCVEVWKKYGDTFNHPDQDLLIKLFCDNSLCGYFKHEDWNLGSGYWDGSSSTLIHCIGGRKPWHSDYQYHLVSELFDRYYVNVFGSVNGLRKNSLTSSLSRRLNNFKIKFGLK